MLRWKQIINKFPYRWFLTLYYFNPMNKEHEIEIILRAGSGSSRVVVNALNRKHGTNITHGKKNHMYGNLLDTL